MSKISKQLAEILERVANDAQFELRNDYTGRGMGNLQTYGLVGYINDWTMFVAYVTCEVNEEDDTKLWNEWEVLLDNIETDSMGRHTIFYFD